MQSRFEWEQVSRTLFSYIYITGLFYFTIRFSISLLGWFIICLIRTYYLQFDMTQPCFPSRALSLMCSGKLKSLKIILNSFLVGYLILSQLLNPVSLQVYGSVQGTTVSLTSVAQLFCPLFSVLFPLSIQPWTFLTWNLKSFHLGLYIY